MNRRHSWCIFIAITLLAGCEMLEEEDITPSESAAAQDISVTFRHIDPRLTVHNVRQFVRDGALFIEGELLNSSQRDMNDLALRVTPFDEQGRVLKRDLPLFYPLPRFLPPGVGARFRIELDPAGVAALAVEVVD